MKQAICYQHDCNNQSHLSDCIVPSFWCLMWTLNRSSWPGSALQTTGKLKATRINVFYLFIFLCSLMFNVNSDWIIQVFLIKWPDSMHTSATKTEKRAAWEVGNRKINKARSVNQSISYRGEKYSGCRAQTKSSLYWATVKSPLNTNRN